MSDDTRIKRDADAASLKAARELVEAQAEDDGLWFRATTAPEAYLQQALRQLHAAIEGDAQCLHAVTLRQEARREHADGEDGRRCCNKIKYDEDEPCTCGADEWNARIDEALK